MMGCVAALASPAPRFATGSSVPTKDSTESNIVLVNVIRGANELPDLGRERIERGNTKGRSH